MLTLIVAAVAIFLLVVAVLAVAAVVECRQLRRIRFDPNAEPFPLTLTEAFDRDHVLLWTTQVPALERIRAAGTRGLRYDYLFATYQQAARRYPELYEGSSFAQWLLFLEHGQLIAMGAYRVRITDTGRQFLDCVTEAVAMAA